MDIQPVMLSGRSIRLEPLQLEHAAALFTQADEPGIWQYMPYGPVDTPGRLHAVIVDLLARQGRGTDLCFTVISETGGQAIGMTRYMEIQRAQRSLEIGGSWLGRAYRGSGANTEAKLLLLTHAFETLGCLRVQFRADLRNERSQRAIEHLGAQREGVFRKHMVMPDGHQRSSVFYAIIDDDWPAVKAGLLARLNQQAGPDRGASASGPNSQQSEEE